jgi:hypothetical protein
MYVCQWLSIRLLWSQHIVFFKVNVDHGSNIIIAEWEPEWAHMINLEGETDCMCVLVVAGYPT